MLSTSIPVSPAAADAADRPLPRGVGLLIGAGASATLWAGLIWGAVALFT